MLNNTFLNKPFCIFIVFAALLSIASISKADTVFSDATFNDANWNITISAASMNGTSIGIQEASGGNPDEYRRVTQEVTSLPGLIQAYHLNSNFVYDPSMSGAIDTIDWSIDFQNLQVGQAVALALQQDGNLFIADVFTTTAAGTGVWNNHALNGIVASDFNLGGLDFSDTAAPITLGFFTANSGQIGIFETGYDNLQITIRTSVPEPSSMLLLGISMGLALICRRGTSICV